MIRKLNKSMMQQPCCILFAIVTVVGVIMAAIEGKFIACVGLAVCCIFVLDVMFGTGFEKIVQKMNSIFNKSSKRQYYERILPKYLRDFPAFRKLHKMLEANLIKMGYKPEEVISPALISRINYKVYTYVNGFSFENLTDVEIAAFVMEDLVDEFSEPDFVADMFDCIKEMLRTPVYYDVTVNKKKEKVKLKVSKPSQVSNPDKFIEKKGGRAAFGEWLLDEVCGRRGHYSSTFCAIQNIYKEAIDL